MISSIRLCVKEMKLQFTYNTMQSTVKNMDRNNYVKQVVSSRLRRNDMSMPMAISVISDD